jgi:DNA-binding NtrC family response regulator
MKAGASDFIAKPWSNPQVLHIVRTALGLAATGGGAEREVVVRREALDARHDFSQIVGSDPRLLRVLDTAGRVAATDAPVLITGESGTGKELVADAIHRNSPRRRQPFVKVNLGGIAASLFESEMFGHVRGAFTDAKADRKGRFALAHGGTIFLDEIGDLDPASQVKLLRVLQDRTFEILGSSQQVTVDVRVVCATNRPLADLVTRGEFREDLLYRINLITLHLPPLRERRDDIPVLAERFLRVIEQVYGREGLRLSADALRWLQHQPWPGNIRQLRQAIERAVLVTGKAEIDARDIEALADRHDGDAQADVLPPVGAMTIDEIEKAMILKALTHHGGNLSRVAQALGLSRPALYRRLEKHGLQV